MKKRLMLAALWAALALCLLPTAALAALDLNTAITDPLFRSAISGLFGGRTTLTDAEVQGVRVIDVSGTAVSSLAGIEYFTQITELNCNGCTQLTALNVSNNALLQTLNCQFSGLTALDVTQNLALKVLDCNNTQIAALNLTNNRALEELFCYNTSLTALDVRNNVNLIALECRNTGLTALDVSQNAALEYLECSNTNLTALNVSQNAALEYLFCSSARLTALDVSQNNMLSYLACRLNYIADTAALEAWLLQPGHSGVVLPQRSLPSNSYVPPRTGDAAFPAAWLLLGLLAGALALGLTWRRATRFGQR